MHGNTFFLRAKVLKKSPSAKNHLLIKAGKTTNFLATLRENINFQIFPKLKIWVGRREGTPNRNIYSTGKHILRTADISKIHIKFSFGRMKKSPRI